MVELLPSQFANLPFNIFSDTIKTHLEHCGTLVLNLVAKYIANVYVVHVVLLLYFCYSSKEEWLLPISKV